MMTIEAKHRKCSLVGCNNGHRSPVSVLFSQEISMQWLLIFFGGNLQFTMCSCVLNLRLSSCCPLALRFWSSTRQWSTEQAAIFTSGRNYMYRSYMLLFIKAQHIWLERDMSDVYVISPER